MREIKFRAKCLIDEEWIFGDLLQPTQICEGYEISDENTIDGSRFPICEETIGQYTGLKDKNGKKIYEGDIVKLHYIKEGLAELIAKVAYSEDYAQYVIAQTKYAIDENEPLCDYEDIEVMGNIYDNPELLEQ